MSDDLLAAALKFVGNGLPVFPCEPRGKQPLVKGGFKAATLATGRVHTWWSKWPTANIGVPTGAVSKLVVLDIDPGGDKSLAALTGLPPGSLPKTRAVRTGRGCQLWFEHPGFTVRCSAGWLGEGLDVRGDGGYVIAPPSIHPNGTRYSFMNDHELARAPEWFFKVLAKQRATPTGGGDGAGKIQQGSRHPALVSFAGSLRARGHAPDDILAGLRIFNQMRCDPPKTDDDLVQIARDAAVWSPSGGGSQPSNPWEAAETLGEFLAGDDEMPTALYEGFLYPATVTEIFSPRGIGKSLFVGYVFSTLVRQGKRVMLVDRDNPRHVVKARLRAWGATETVDKIFRVITRDRCPPLTNAAAWALFPYNDYDVVILDSFDSLAEGVGEQDSARPSRAIAPLLDIARRERGPAVMVLGNCVRSGAHSRGSGVIEDRSDIVYEVRDATNFQPTGGKPWVDELPLADAKSWASRSARRKQREKYRLAFVSTKFRGGPEPDPFVLEIDTATEPWTLHDVTDEVDCAGAEAREAQRRPREERENRAIEALKWEIGRRHRDGEPPLVKDRGERSAVELLKGNGLGRNQARQILRAGDGVHWILGPILGERGNPVGVLPVQTPTAPESRTETSRGANYTDTAPSKTELPGEQDLRHPHAQAPAQMHFDENRSNCSAEEGVIRAADALDSSFELPLEGEL